MPEQEQEQEQEGYDQPQQVGEEHLQGEGEGEGEGEEEEEEVDDDQDRPELGHLASWSVSSHKYGFGVDNLRDGNDGTFWQSEGPQPHLIDLSFPRRVQISAIAVHTSHPRDDSYTPSKISIRAGTGVHDLQEIRLVEMTKPDGWIPIVLRPMELTDDGHEEEGPPIPCHHLRILIVANHLNGKDTHVRGLRVFGPAGQNPHTHPHVQPLPALPVPTPTPLPTAELTDISMMSDDDSPSAASATRKRQGGQGEGKRLLYLGHDGLSGFTSPAFKMHEWIR